MANATAAPNGHGPVPNGLATLTPDACGGASTEGGFPSVGIWRWKPSRSTGLTNDS
ncbi:hypothetical protein HW132_00390 [Brasilonema sp. CT11]|nr:hypothetical protein [Brasilonema sp. CT11]